MSHTETGLLADLCLSFCWFLSLSECVSLSASVCAWQTLAQAHGANAPPLKRKVKAHLFVFVFVSYPSFGIATCSIWGLNSQLLFSVMRQRLGTSWGVKGRIFEASHLCKSEWEVKLASFVWVKSGILLCFLYALYAWVCSSWTMCFEWQWGDHMVYLWASLGSPPNATWFSFSTEHRSFFTYSQNGMCMDFQRCSFSSDISGSE